MISPNQTLSAWISLIGMELREIVHSRNILNVNIFLQPKHLKFV